METFPKIGMTYEQVRSRMLKDASKYKQNQALSRSILNQCNAHEGEKACKELANDVFSAWCGNRRRGYNCSGNRQSGFGDGLRANLIGSGFKKIGAGKYRKIYS